MQQTCIHGECIQELSIVVQLVHNYLNRQRAETTTKRRRRLGCSSLRRSLHHLVSWKCTAHQTLLMLFHVAPGR